MQAQNLAKSNVGASPARQTGAPKIVEEDGDFGGFDLDMLQSEVQDSLRRSIDPNMQRPALEQPQDGQGQFQSANKRRKREQKSANKGGVCFRTRSKSGLS